MDTAAVIAVNVNVPPVLIDGEPLIVPEPLNVPPELNTEKCVNVEGDVSAHEVHDGNVAAAAFEPDDADDHVRVLEPAVLSREVVPAAPGAAVWR